MNVINHVNHPLFAVPGTIPKSATPFDSSANGASGTGATPGSSNSNSSSASASNNLISPNSFITLLTTQLQAQDPTNPLDPTQLVSQLISMNTLQQTIQIQQDLATLDNLASSGTTPATGASSAATRNVASTAAATTATNANGSSVSGSAALPTPLLNSSFALPSSAAAALYSNASQTSLY